MATHRTRIEADPRGVISTNLSPQDLREIYAHLGDLLRIVSKVAARDFSEKPPLLDGEDPLAQFTVAFRFMIEDLERSLSELERERAELRRANQQLADVATLKTRFINSAAHELGTPLTPIRLELHMLKDGSLGPLNEEQTKAVGILDRNLGRLTDLVQDMLDIVRLESGRLELRRSACDVGGIVRQCVESFDESARKAGVALRCDVAPDLWGTVDPNRITQVLFNLLSNAIKFTPSGGSVDVVAIPESGAIQILVEDTGVGLAPDEAKRLFQPFSQVGDPVQHASAGTGLGLYISRGLVEQHGGRIWCESDGPGRGCRFYVTLPFAAPRGPDPVSVSQAT